jgi:hypothetical protein
MMKKGYLIALICVCLASCKTTKGIKDNSKSVKLNTKTIISSHYAKKSIFTTLKASLKVNLKTAEKEEAVVANVRLLKDQKIWISIRKLGYTGAKILITPETVQYYNKIDKVYFDGDFSLISSWLGTDLSFQQLQAVLLGETMFPLDASKYNTEILDNGYLLIPKKQEALAEHFITINPSDFKIKEQEIAQPKLIRILNIEYNSYQNVSQQLLPLLINLSLVDKTSETQVEVTYKNISLNQELRYPFNIPTNYKEISFEK